MTETPLDRAHAAMEAAPDDDGARLRFFDRLAEAELYLLLERPAEGETIDPRVFDTDDGRFLIAFDQEERLASFAGAADYAALSGRRLAAMVAGSDLGLALNPEVAPSTVLLPPAALDWLAELLSDAPAEADLQLEEVAAPAGLPEPLLNALDAKFAAMAGRARSAFLARVQYAGGGTGHLLAFLGTAPGAEGALARAVHEALQFSGLDAAALDVGFVRDSDPIAARLARVALRFDLPEPEAPSRLAGDADTPPRLR